MLFFLLCGCGVGEEQSESVNVLEGKKCSKCGAAAECYTMGGGVTYTAGYSPNNYDFSFGFNKRVCPENPITNYRKKA